MQQEKIICTLFFCFCLLGLSACATANIQEQAAKRSADARFEQDRKAILAMAGDYVVEFNFAETVALRKDYELTDPYFATAQEIVEVIEDSGKRIDLQHILLVDEGKRIVKHWRQTWIYEPNYIYEFKGQLTWEPRAISSAESKGAWAQTVYQVDDSPRYAGVGHWSHIGNLSSWESDSWRPLPRREYTKRSDYDVLVARNRHTLVPNGWIHEQDNYKLVLEDTGHPVIAREVGLNTYTRTSNIDFSLARDYWKDTFGFWADVRGHWSEIMDGQRTVKMIDKLKEKPLYQHMFTLAGSTREKPDEEAANTAEALKTIDAFLSGVNTKAASLRTSEEY